MQIFIPKNIALGMMLVVLGVLCSAFFATLFYGGAKDAAAALGNVVGGIIGALGAAVAVYLTFEAQRSRDERSMEESVRSLATILVVEIHNRASRCLLDGTTWVTRHVDGTSSRKRTDCPKFRPFPPTVYRAVADRLTHLPSGAAHQVVRFYNALEAADRQIEELTENPQALTGHGTGVVATQFTTSTENSLVAARLHQTFLPALEALTSLLPIVGKADKLEEDLCRADRQYLGTHTVLSALGVSKPPLLREALRARLEWFRGHRQLGKFVHYPGDGRGGGESSSDAGS